MTEITKTMPDIADRSYSRRTGLLSVSPAYAPGAEGTPSLPARLFRALALVCEAARSRVAEIVDAEIRYEELSDAFTRCELCGVIHHQGDACDAAAVGFCVDCGRERLIEAERCRKCGLRAVTNVRYIQSFRGGRA